MPAWATARGGRRRGSIRPLTSAVKVIINHLMTVHDYMNKRAAQQQWAERRKAWMRERYAAEQAAATASQPDPAREQREDKAMTKQAMLPEADAAFAPEPRRKKKGQAPAAAEEANDPAPGPDPGLGPDRSPGLATVAAAEVEAEELEWLWPGRLALGKLGLLIGDPDNGKSLVALDMAARVSHGRPWPDGTPAPLGEVLIVSGEDDAGDTLRPRLEAAGADLARVHLFREVIGAAEAPTRRSAPLDASRPTPASGGGGFSLKIHLEALERWLGGHREVRLVIFDPLSAATAGADAHRDAAVRGLLAPLATLAQRHGTAILGVVHLNKRGGDKPIYRASGSLAFVAAARHVYAIGRDRCDANRRLMARVKNNLSQDETGLVFTIEASALGPPVLAWEPEPVELDAHGVLGAAETMTEQRRRASETERWLRKLLEDGPQPVRDVQNLAEEDHIPWRNVERAKARIGAVARRAGFDDGSYWSWALPEDETEEAEEATESDEGSRPTP